MNEYNIIHKPITVWQIYLIKAFRCHVQNLWIGPFPQIALSYMFDWVLNMPGIYVSATFCILLVKEVL